MSELLDTDCNVFKTLDAHECTLRADLNVQLRLSEDAGTFDENKLWPPEELHL